jgi:phosphomannomutase
MTTAIKFGTDGWRAVIGKEYTFYNVARVSEAVALWLNQQKTGATVLMGYDCRFNGKFFAQIAAQVLANNGIKVLLAPDFASTPMVAFGTVQLKADLGIVITASHNPPEYNGYKLKGDFGGPLPQPDVDAVQSMIPDALNYDPNQFNFEDVLKPGMVEYVGLEELYLKHVRASFDLEAIANSPFKFAFDAMFGSGQNVISALLPEVDCLHCEYNPSFKGIPPEPLARNLQEFQSFVKINKIDCGFATDGDADRIALIDSEGNFIDAHHIILILIHYLKHYKKLEGNVVTAVSSSVKIEQLCIYYGLELDVVKIGFKYTSELMRMKDILVGGEESGGIAVKGHIPERDGIWIALVIWEFMAKSGKSLRQIIEEIYAIVGPFAFERRDLRLSEDQKNRIVAKCESGDFKIFGDYNVISTNTLDGYKYTLSESEWVMIRPSGTEPVLRIYAEAANAEIAKNIIENTLETVLKI